MSLPGDSHVASLLGMTLSVCTGYVKNSALCCFLNVPFKSRTPFLCGRPRVAHFAFEIVLSGAITLTILLVCAFSPRVHSIPRGPRYYALAFELHKLCGHEVDGTCSATLRAQAFYTPFFCAANAVAITPGTKNSALCCFLNVPFKSLTPLQKKDLHNECTSHFFGAVDGT